MLLDSPIELCDRAYGLYQGGDPARAEGLCRRLLEQAPRHAQAWYLLGVIATDRGQVDQARSLIGQAAELAPENPVFINTLGELQLTQGRAAEARAFFHRAIALRPGYERAHNNLGRVLHAEGDLESARASFAEAVRLNPRYPTALNNLGAVLQAQYRLPEALACFERALVARPDYPEAHFNRGSTFQAQGDPIAAAACFREAIRCRPAYARAHFHLGQALERCRRDYEALACYEAAVRLQPDDAEMHRRLGMHLVVKKDWPAALAALERAVALKANDPEPFASLASARLQVCDWRTYPADLDRLQADAEKAVAAGEATPILPFHALSLPWSNAQLLAVARSHSGAWVRHHRDQRQVLDVSHPGRARPGRIRVGYFSGDFYDHPISHLLHGFFGRHDREHFEVFAYSFATPDQSPFRRRIVAECEHFVEVGPLSCPDLARRIAGDGIQILVDLMGHTGVNRLATLALRPAPIQVSFLGMLGTTGADFIDYLIADAIVTPAEFAPSFTERFVTLPHSYLIAEPEPVVPTGAVDRAALGLPDDGFVFCCFNSAYKVEPRTFDVWMRILARVSGSVLWLCSPGRVVEENLRREAAARGIDPNRLVFAPFIPRADHLRRHRAAGLFLDTLLYNAAATASLSLQVGVPVLTCLGDTFASRVGASILAAVGLPELVAADVAEYERLAIELARDPDRLHRLRERLAAVRTTAPLFDTPRFVRNLERAYQQMWSHHAAGGSPQPVEVIEDEGSPPRRCERFAELESVASS